MIRSNNGESRTRRRFSDLFQLSAWGSRQPWRPTETEPIAVQVRGTRKLGAGRLRIHRRRKAA